MKSLKIALVFTVPLVALTAWVWLSGFFYLGISKLDTSQASFFTLYDYFHYYGHLDYVQKNIGLATFGALLVVLAPGALFLIKPPEKLHGDARWAKPHEIRKAGLMAEDGIIVGQVRSFFGLFRKILILGGSQHVALAAPTRSGKGVGIVIPNLLSFKDSVVVLDIKKENWETTAGFRAAHGQECYLLNLAPRDHKTHRWNPLTYISEDPAFRINDIQTLGQMLFPNNEHEAPIWQASSRSLWLGIILYLFETENLPLTLGEALRQVTGGDDQLKAKIEERQAGDNPLSAECFLALKEYLDTPEKTRGSVRKGFTSALELLYNPMIDLATSGNDFDLRDIRKKRMSIYVAVTPNDLDRLQPLLNLFFQQLIDLNIQELPEHNPALKYQCLILPDEFAALGRVNILTKSISFIAGYGLRMLPVFQSQAQLREVYGADTAENFITNHALKIIYPPKEIKDAEEISKTLGTKTVKSKSKSKSRPSDLFGKSNHTNSESEQARALLMPQEIVQLPNNVEFLLYENTPPIKCEKIRWYEDDIFAERGNNLKTGVEHYATPEVPTVDLKNRVIGTMDLTFKSNESDTEIISRSVTSDDLEKIDELNLDDFSCDFSAIEIPAGEISDDQMAQLVNQFMNCISEEEEL